MKHTPGIMVVIFSLIGLGILYGVSIFTESAYVPLDKIAQYETAFIRTKGVVSDLSVTESGHMRVNIRTDQTELLVFVNSAAVGKKDLDLCYGDEIEVEGRVDMYQGEYEIIAPIEGIKKLTSSSSNISFVSQIATRPEEYERTRISVVGYTDDIFKRVFYLISDENGRYRMRVVVGDVPISALQKDTKIIAEGILEYNPEDMGYELNLLSWRDCKGEKAM